MNKLILVVLWFFLAISLSHGQNMEVSAGVDYAYYYGDLNTKNLEGKSSGTVWGRSQYEKF